MAGYLVFEWWYVVVVSVLHIVSLGIVRLFSWYVSNCCLCSFGCLLNSASCWQSKSVSKTSSSSCNMVNQKEGCHVLVYSLHNRFHHQGIGYCFLLHDWCGGYVDRFSSSPLPCLPFSYHLTGSWLILQTVRFLVVVCYPGFWLADSYSPAVSLPFL